MAGDAVEVEGTGSAGEAMAPLTRSPVDESVHDARVCCPSKPAQHDPAEAEARDTNREFENTESNVQVRADKQAAGWSFAVTITKVLLSLVLQSTLLCFFGRSNFETSLCRQHAAGDDCPT